jgi:hypothetical protein
LSITNASGLLDTLRSVRVAGMRLDTHMLPAAQGLLPPLGLLAYPLRT